MVEGTLTMPLMGMYKETYYIPIFVVDINYIPWYSFIMLKLSTEHNIYEIWCEHTAESVFLDHKPSKSELDEIRKKEWPIKGLDGKPVKLKAFKLAHYYTTYIDVTLCEDCNGNGIELTDMYYGTKCETCNGTGKIG